MSGNDEFSAREQREQFARGPRLPRGRAQPQHPGIQRAGVGPETLEGECRDRLGQGQDSRRLMQGEGAAAGG